MIEALSFQMPLGLPGLTSGTEFTLEPRVPGSAYAWLRCRRDPQLTLLTIEASRVRPDYPVEHVRRSLGFLHLEPDEALHVMLLCTVPAAPEPATVNLVAPIGLGMQCLKAAQIVLHDPALEERLPLPG